MTTLKAVSALLLLASLTGCSFRAPHPIRGEVSDIRVLATGLGVPTRVSAHVAFRGTIDAPTLAIVQGTDVHIIRLMTFATPSLPMFGFGVMPVDRTSRNAFDLETSLVVTQAGRYRIEGFSEDDEVVTATAEFNIE